MACDVCGHTMQTVGFRVNYLDGETQIAWCPRCGTLKDDQAASQPPAVVKRLADAASCFYDEKTGPEKHDRFVRLMANAAEAIGIAPEFKLDREVPDVD